ncbi:MAG: hypothetical protein IT270_18140, partial [Saprospiraceae bacterium]|nr:hypothetical protein [Saprospiraceae bacterium]MCC6413584.1 hypothetical protein [Saprospiraceae bacterium]
MKAKNFTRLMRFMSALLVLGGFSAILAPSALQAQANLRVVSVTHTTSPLEPGTVETFSIVVRNNGPNAAADPTVLFLLYDLDFVMASYSGDPDWDFHSSGGTFQRKGNMPDGEIETIEFSVFIPSDAAFNSTGLFADAVYAQIQSNTADPNYANNEATTSLVSQARSTLTIDKKLLTPNVAPGGYALYEISVRNLGPSDIGGITVLDVPGANLVGSAVLSPNSFNLYIPSGDARSVFASVQVDPAAPVGASFSNTASISTGGAVSGAGTNAPPVFSVGSPDTDGTGVV